jgi:transcriptional regulator with XRE-family HTH domain
MKKDVLEKFGARVREKRISLGLSQEELADRAGVHRTYIGMVERAEKNITLKNIEKIANALQVPVSELMKLDS